MDSQELKAFTEFLRLADATNRRKPTFYESFAFKFVSSAAMFATSVATFRYFGDLLI
jgi:hypothetical protein